MIGRLLVTVAVLAAAGSPGFGQTNRAVSLKVLQSVLKSGQSAQAEQLCGITRVSGYVVDSKNRDIILLGQVDPDCPTLYLEDFVVAMRNSRMMYARVEGNTYYYTAPGCSIDPDPKVLKELQQLSGRIATMDDPEEKRKGMDDWQTIGAKPQTVRVMGVPFDSRFAKVMVDADYYMKRLVNGSVQLNIVGFTSLMDATINASQKALDTGNEDLTPAGSLSRFWFCPGESTYDDSSGAVEITSCAVKLLTEEEFLTKSGRVAGMGRPNPLAGGFANGFTAHYPEVAESRPIYKDLEGLFRFVAIANVMRDQKASTAAGLDLSFYLNRYQVKTTPVSRTLPGITTIRELTSETKVEGGRAMLYRWHMSCGGVSMDVHPKRVRTARAASAPPRPATGGKPTTRASGPKPSVGASVPTVKKTVLAARKSSTSLYWDFPAGK